MTCEYAEATGCFRFLIREIIYWIPVDQVVTGLPFQILSTKNFVFLINYYGKLFNSILKLTK